MTNSYVSPSFDCVNDSARLGVLRPAGIGFTSASCSAYSTMNGAMIPSGSAGWIHRHPREMYPPQARVRAREDLAGQRQSGDAGSRPGTSAPDDRALTQALARGSRGDQAPGTPPIERASTTSRPTNATPAAVQAALDRFYKYMET